MSRKLLPLADLKRQLAKHSSGPGADLSARPVARSNAAQPAPRRAVVVEDADELSLFRSAIAGAQALPPSNQAEIRKPLPKPIPRPREAAPDKPLQPSTSNSQEDWVPAAWLAEDSSGKPLSGQALDLATALRGVTPISTDRITPEAPKPKPLPIQHELDEQAALAESIYAPTSLELRMEGGEELTYLENGVPRSVVRDLRRGRWVVQDELDLHGSNRDEARELLAACMGQWKKRGVRCVRVVHGKGRGSPGREPVLKKLVAGWLMNYADVMAYCQARLPDGGAGALIVLLKAVRPGPLL
ncbi:hypothetical protein GCM10027046_18140 [Uliginosibacterium flavum]|uniref:Smr/MutS family protein n=1 Tax=Uliginosibacterium flavum TaxID=1396831 RepID=A0ABV2THH3_9RHOO